MSHLHLPDGLLPVWLWAPALGLVVALLAATGRSVEPRRVAYQGSVGAMMLAAMAIPLGPLDYHLSLTGPVGVLLGPAASLQVVFVVSVVLAFVGHGGLTVVGLNALVLGVAAATSHLAFAALSRRLSPPASLALASVVGQALSGLGWFGIVSLALFARHRPTSLEAAPPRLEVMGSVVIALWVVGVLVEAAVAYGVGRFLARVHPGLLPMPEDARTGAA